MLFDPCFDLDRSREPCLFGFPDESAAGLQEHLIQTFPFKEDHAANQHWHLSHFNEYEITVFRLKPEYYERLKEDAEAQAAAAAAAGADGVGGGGAGAGG